MESSTVQCPACGKSASGKFCQHCGAALTGRAPATRWNAQASVPWVALGLATVSLGVSIWTALDDGNGAVQPASVRFSAAAPADPAAPGQPPDLSSMSPREAADRLFNRVMAASENGNTSEALQFVPMALAAYERAGTLDNDARYHVALIHLTAGDMKSARAEIGRLRQAVPNHLLGLMLEHEIAARAGNNAGAARSNRAFLAAYAAEIATARPEYQDHASSIERFHAAAQASQAGKQ